MYPLNMCEMWASITLNAAQALGLEKQGAIAKGMTPRISIFDCPRVSDITYSWGKNFCNRSISL